MKIHQLSTDQALQSLNSFRSGLPEAMSHKRRLEFGPNRVEVRQKESPFLALLHQFTHFFALLLWATAAFAFLHEYYNPGSGMGVLGGAILLVLLVNGVFAFIQEYKAEHAIGLLLQLLPRSVKVLRDSQVLEVNAEDLVPGDMVRISAGDKVPADCRVIESLELRTDESILTGESQPRTKSSEPDHDTHIENEGWRSSNIILAGALVISGHADALVFATGIRTEFGRVVRLTAEVKREASPLQREIAQLSQRIGLLSVIIGLVFYLLGRMAGLPATETALFAIGVLVANVPEGLLPTVTLSLAMAAQRMARRKAIVRHLPSVETLGAVNVICTDKTGTLTENRMSIAQIEIPGEASIQSVAGQKLLMIARNCHEVEKINGPGSSAQQWRGDPLDISLVTWSSQVSGAPEELSKLDEIPFDSDRRRVTTLHPGWVFTKGALEAVLPVCTCIQDKDVERFWTGDDKNHVESSAREMAGKGQKADLKSEDRELTFVGLIGFQDPPRKEVPDAIRKCAEAGIRVVMVTGDHPDTAVAVARQIGLIPTQAMPNVITGIQLRHLSESQLQLTLDLPDLIFARVDSTQKVDIVRAFKRKRQVVAVTGDGVNDAPALKDADIGIAMGASGTDVAREAADIVLMDNNFATIVTAVEEGRAVFKNIRKFLTYILTSNIPELVPYLLFIIFKIPLPLTVIQILAVDLGTDLLPALALGADPPAEDVMKEGPRPRNERLASPALFLRAYLFLGMFEAFAAMSIWYYTLYRGGWRFGQSLVNDSLYLESTTACLTAIVLMQIANLFVCRAGRLPLKPLKLNSNPLLLPGIAFELILLLIITYTGLGNLLFGTTALPWQTWLLVVPFALALVAVNEIAKSKRLCHFP